MKFLKNNLKVIIAFILGTILTGGIVYAATTASQLTYTTTKNSEVKNVEDALNDLYINSSRFELLWINESPTSDFESQTLNFNLSNFNYVLIKTKRYKNDDPNSGLNPQYSIIKIGESRIIMGIDSNYAYHYMRNVSATTTGITFGNTYSRGYGLSGSDSGCNGCAIPLKIYAIKGENLI